MSLSLQDPPPDPAARELLSAAHDAAGDPAALAQVVNRAVVWVLAGAQGHFDDVYKRWLSVERLFHDLDLSLWERSPVNVETLAIALSQIDYYRQTDLSFAERLELLSRVRKLLSPRHHQACARVDLERAELVSIHGGAADLARALTLCDDALGAIEQLEDPSARADALLSRAHVLLRGDRVKEAVAEAEAARAIYEQRDHTHALANVCLFLAEVHVGRSRVPEAAICAGEAIEGYRKVHDSVGEANALRLRARTWKSRGKALRAFQDCEDAVRLYALARMRTSQGRALLLRSEFLADAARFPEAQSDLEAAIGYLEESPEDYLLGWVLIRLADLLRRRNDLDGATARLDEAELTLPGVLHPRDRTILLVNVCQVAKDLPTPDKPRIRRCSAAAQALARSLDDADLERSATSFASFAG